MALIETSYEILKPPSMVEVFLAFLLGLIIGWAWKPNWVTFRLSKLTCHLSEILGSYFPLKPSASASCFNSFLSEPENDGHGAADNKPPSMPSTQYENCGTSKLSGGEEQSSVSNLVTEKDLEHLYKLVEMKDGGPTWTPIMDRSTSTMSYQAWKREPKTGPPQYYSRTVFESATPEMVRDFFCDDEFRKNWDDMLAYSAIIDECPWTGTMVVQWIRKFPFFCSDREYIIGRRIWESDRSYYCVTKGVPYPSLPRCDNPRRVDLYYSSWCIRAAESRIHSGQLTACEVLLFHHENMGIPWEIAKLGVRMGMWDTVKKIEPGLRAYQKARASGTPLSRTAIMAQITTKINLQSLRFIEDNESPSEATGSKQPLGNNMPKLLIIGGAIVVALSMERGLLTKAFIFGVARKITNIGKGL